MACAAELEKVQDAAAPRAVAASKAHVASCFAALATSRHAGSGLGRRAELGKRAVGPGAYFVHSKWGILRSRTTSYGHITRKTSGHTSHFITSLFTSKGTTGTPNSFGPSSTSSSSGTPDPARHRVVQAEDEAVILKADAHRAATAVRQLESPCPPHLGLTDFEPSAGRGELGFLPSSRSPYASLHARLNTPSFPLRHLLDPCLQRWEQRALPIGSLTGALLPQGVVRNLTAGELQHIVDGHDLVVFDGGHRTEGPAAPVSENEAGARRELARRRRRRSERSGADGLTGAPTGTWREQPRTCLGAL